MASPKPVTDPDRCEATRQTEGFRTHKTVRCDRPVGHEGEHFAAVGGSQAWRQYSWPYPPCPSCGEAHDPLDHEESDYYAFLHSLPR